MIQIDMEMPDSCRECWFLTYDTYSGRTSCAIEDMTLAQYFKALDFEGRHEECPLIDVPDYSDKKSETSDMISRQEAIEVTDAIWTVTGDKNVVKVWQQLKELPSAQPERKKGEWIHVGFMTEECSECHKQYHELEYGKYCPNCGADMRGEQDE